jgi:hypothetical protein
MKISDVHTRAVAGWDITVTATGEKGEQVALVQVRVNGFPEPDEAPNPPVHIWQKTYRQKGVFPGDNRLQVTVKDTGGAETRFEDQWS